MRTFVLIFAILVLNTAAYAKDRDWQDAEVMGVTSGTTGALAVPVGNMVYAAPTTEQIFWIKSGDIVYGLRRIYMGHPPNLTVHGHTKIAFEGHVVHIFDDDKKDRRFVIVQKIASKQP